MHGGGTTSLTDKVLIRFRVAAARAPARRPRGRPRSPPPPAPLLPLPYQPGAQDHAGRAQGVHPDPRRAGGLPVGVARQQGAEEEDERDQQQGAQHDAPAPQEAQRAGALCALLGGGRVGGGGDEWRRRWLAARPCGCSGACTRRGPRRPLACRLTTPVPRLASCPIPSKTVRRAAGQVPRGPRGVRLGRRGGGGGAEQQQQRGRGQRRGGRRRGAHRQAHRWAPPGGGRGRGRGRGVA
jgi:hypothetical protein